MNDDRFDPIDNSPMRPFNVAEGGSFCLISPVPEYAPDPPRNHPKLGNPSQRWTYRDGEGTVLGYVWRFDSKSGEKCFRPLTLWADKSDGRLFWRWVSWNKPRPLYSLERLAADPDAIVVVCEGEKAADAAAKLLPACVAITSPNGSRSASKADWSLLSGRHIVIWPDADAPGQDHATQVTACLNSVEAGSIQILTPPADVPDGWDAADALADGWDTHKAQDLLASSTPIEADDQGGKAKNEADHTSRRDRKKADLIAAADGAALWHDDARVAYATIPIRGHFENWPLESDEIKDCLSGRHFQSTGIVASSQQLGDVLRVLSLQAKVDGPLHQSARRIAWCDGACWIDLCDDRWRSVRIDADGWSVVDDPPVKFIRSDSSRALPEPAQGGSVSQLRAFINCNDDDFKLIVAWLTAALWGKASSYPVLMLSGEQGSGKSTMAKLLRSLVDPAAVDLATPPNDDRSLFVMASNTHVMSLDNMSKIDGRLSDAICRLATGAGFATRKLHTNNKMNWFAGARPIIVNGIPNLIARADLADRCLNIRLHGIDDSQRRPEDEFWRAWEAVRLGILGALCDAISTALRRIGTVKCERYPRMADFAKLMEAASPSLGWGEGEFAEAYKANRQSTNNIAFEDDDVAVTIEQFMSQIGREGNWSGTATELLAQLNRIAPNHVKRLPSWPKKSNGLGSALERATPLLRQRGLSVAKKSTGARRLIDISWKC